jgi:multisubunit Na+/H+ antiporter MnhG subunit
MSNHAAPAASKSPPWTYLLLIVSVAGLVALALPWFRPTIGGHTLPGEATTYSWNGILFFLAPLLMVIAAVQAVTSRGRLDALRRVSGRALLAGVLTLVSAGVGWVRVPSNYRDWNAAKALAASRGVRLDRGPMIGSWLAVVVGGLLVVLGGIGLVQFRRSGRRHGAVVE